MSDFYFKALRAGEPVEIPPRTIQLKPTALFFLPTGAIDDGPSLAVILSTQRDPVVVAQITIRMLLEAFTDGELVAAKSHIEVELRRRRVSLL